MFTRIAKRYLNVLFDLIYHLLFCYTTSITNNNNFNNFTMGISINSIDSLQTYLNGVLGRADHHAKNIEGVALH